jgi:RNA polymerase sigma-B factor
LYLSVKQARNELTNSLGASPTVRQIADFLETTEAAVLDAMGAGDNFWPASLDKRTGDEPPTEVPVVDLSLDQSLDRLQVQRRLPELDESEHLVLKRIYFDSFSQREVAAELGVSQMQVSRILARALSKLRS